MGSEKGQATGKDTANLFKRRKKRCASNRIALRRRSDLKDTIRNKAECIGSKKEGASTESGEGTQPKSEWRRRGGGKRKRKSEDCDPKNN